VGLVGHMVFRLEVDPRHDRGRMRLRGESKHPSRPYTLRFIRAALGQMRRTTILVSRQASFENSFEH